MEDVMTDPGDDRPIKGLMTLDMPTAFSGRQAYGKDVWVIRKKGLGSFVGHQRKQKTNWPVSRGAEIPSKIYRIYRPKFEGLWKNMAPRRAMYCPASVGRNPRTFSHIAP